MQPKKRTKPKGEAGPECEHLELMFREMPPMTWARSLIPFGLLCSGCTYAPSVPLFGAFFPAWMLCALLGVGLVIIVRILCVATGLARVVAVPPVTYPLLAILFAAAGWILFFRG
ncbi:MAG TPA: YtcA family lipoprotein [Burkholderiaceae bacterium]|jgi:hypothetical protein|nr:YtcA family lipoprotein [Burkholderiaceae bacterium]